MKIGNIVTLTTDELRTLLMQAWDNGADWTVDAMRVYGENYSPSTEHQAKSDDIENMITELA
jgi:hypothetical protein